MITGNCQETIAKLIKDNSKKIPVTQITEKDAKDKEAIEHLLKTAIFDFTGYTLNNNTEYEIKMAILKNGDVSESKAILKRKKFYESFFKSIADASGIYLQITLASGLELIPFIVTKA